MTTLFIGRVFFLFYLNWILREASVTRRCNPRKSWPSSVSRASGVECRWYDSTNKGCVEMTWGWMWGERGDIYPGKNSVEVLARKCPRICISSIHFICVLDYFSSTSMKVPSRCLFRTSRSFLSDYFPLIVHLVNNIDQCFVSLDSLLQALTTC
jgi:hypothetical protein